MAALRTRSFARRTLSVAVGMTLLVGGLAVAAPAQAAGTFTTDHARQIKGGDVPRFQEVKDRRCIQYVNAQPSYVTVATCMPMPISYAQLWLFDSTTHQISVTLPSSLGSARLCLDALAASSPVQAPVQITPCLTDTTLPGFASQKWDAGMYGGDFGNWLRNRGNGLCIGTSTSPVTPDPLVMRSCDNYPAMQWFSVDAVWPLSGFVWADANGDGVKDSTESGVGGVRVHVRDGDGAALSPDMTMLTSSNTLDGNLGRYRFSVPPGTYRVDVDLPAGYGFTLKDAPGSAESNDSDVDSTGLTDQIVAPEQTILDVQPGAYYTQVNAGLVSG
jgi:hypothetical protein